MLIVDKELSRDELRKIAAEGFGDMVKGVVDIDECILAIDADLHADLEALLLEHGSKQSALWGINLYPDIEDEDFLEYDSLINIRPNQGNRSRGVDDEATRQLVAGVVYRWVKL